MDHRACHCWSGSFGRRVSDDRRPLDEVAPWLGHLRCTHKEPYWRLEVVTDGLFQGEEAVLYVTSSGQTPPKWLIRPGSGRKFKRPASVCLTGGTRSCVWGWVGRPGRLGCFVDPYTLDDAKDSLDDVGPVVADLVAVPLRRDEISSRAAASGRGRRETAQSPRWPVT